MTSGPGEQECVFCALPPDRVVVREPLAVALRDAFPVSEGHTLVIPRRHIADWWSATPEERAAISGVVDRVKRNLDAEFSPSGYNVGFNDGTAAGQTVHHLHVHVIPRYDGDVPDARGGIRHVIPDRANYLVTGPLHEASAAEGVAEEVSVVEAGLDRGMESAELIQRLLALLDDGRRAATYKPALLLALVELSVERAERGRPLALPVSDVAERVMELYWPQTRPHEAVEGTLRQATGRSSRIIDALMDLRSVADAAVNETLGRVRLTRSTEFLAARKRVADALARQPIPRLQRPGISTQGMGYPAFLYDDTDFVADRGWVHKDEEPSLTLRAGVADSLARSAPLLRMATQDVWVREVAAINRLRTQEQSLRSFLFGADRSALRTVADGLLDLGARRCFWCGGPLGRGPEVDHVIPWSHYPNDDLFNLVLSDRSCNQQKRDLLVTAQLVERWTSRDLAGLAAMATELRWTFEPIRSVQVGGSAYRYLPDGMPVWAGRDRKELFSADERERVRRTLRAFASDAA